MSNTDLLAELRQCQTELEEASKLLFPSMPGMSTIYAAAADRVAGVIFYAPAPIAAPPEKAKEAGEGSPTQARMSQAFYVDVCNAERRINELVDAGKKLLSTLPKHWHDDAVTDFNDLVEDTEAVMNPGSHHAQRTENAKRDYHGKAVHEARTALAAASSSIPAPIAAPGRTDQQIVDQTEELGRFLLKEAVGTGYHVAEGRNLRDMEHGRGAFAWRLACEIQEMLTATDPLNALANLQEV
jgi:ElaB/YqjD/DUF883 family membrane-anchored ribosome-binding protein